MFTETDGFDWIMNAGCGHMARGYSYTHNAHIHAEALHQKKINLLCVREAYKLVAQQYTRRSQTALLIITIAVNWMQHKHYYKTP